MKKFSNISGEKVTEQKPIEKKSTSEVDMLKMGIYKLMDNYLAVQMYGPITRYHVAGSMKVVGKELFLEALINMLEELTTKDKVKMLENMKNESSDWKMLDDKIDELNKNLGKFDNHILSHKSKIKSIYNRYKGDEKELLEQIDISTSKIKNGKTAYLRTLASNSLMIDNEIPSDILRKISEKYLSKSISLGFISE